MQQDYIYERLSPRDPRIKLLLNNSKPVCCTAINPSHIHTNERQRTPRNPRSLFQLTHSSHHAFPFYRGLGSPHSRPHRNEVPGSLPLQVQRPQHRHRLLHDIASLCVRGQLPLQRLPLCAEHTPGPVRGQLEDWAALYRKPRRQCHPRRRLVSALPVIRQGPNLESHSILHWRVSLDSELAIRRAGRCTCWRSTLRMELVQQNRQSRDVHELRACDYRVIEAAHRRSVIPMEQATQHVCRECEQRMQDVGNGGRSVSRAGAGREEGVG